MKNNFRHTKILSHSLLVIVGFVSFSLPIQAQLVTPVKTGFDLAKAVIYIDSGEEILVKKSASILQQDIERVTGKKIPVVSQFEKSIRHYIIIGTTIQSPVINALGKTGYGNLRDNPN